MAPRDECVPVGRAVPAFLYVQDRLLERNPAIDLDERPVDRFLESVRTEVALGLPKLFEVDFDSRLVHLRRLYRQQRRLAILPSEPSCVDKRNPYVFRLTARFSRAWASIVASVRAPHAPRDGRVDSHP